ncbi:hypothetical protein KH5H1_29140 [Corallococcus caeni]|nr:hypothetical protein KH5H1_29140 [Corallococcus sp. KH5-1]
MTEPKAASVRVEAFLPQALALVCAAPRGRRAASTVEDSGAAVLVAQAGGTEKDGPVLEFKAGQSSRPFPDVWVQAWGRHSGKAR